MKTIRLSIEPLETRLAPAALAFTDVDGDKVVITASGPGALVDGGNVTIVNGQLRTLDLTATAFQGASVSIVATPDPVAGGDGFVNVGFIKANGIDLGTVLVDGDLGAIDAGNPANSASACRGLTVQSLGRLGTATGAPNLQSDFDGKLDKLTVKSDVNGAFVNVTGAIGPVFIAGSVIGGSSDNSGSIVAAAGMGAVKIGRDLTGGSGNASGIIRSAAEIASVTIGGSLLGGANPTVALDSGAGVIDAAGVLGPVRIAGDVRGGLSSFSGAIRSDVQITSIAIGGSLLGGSGISGFIDSGGPIGAMKIGRDVAAASNGSGAEISANSSIASVTIGGSLRGGTGFDGGAIRSTFGAIGPVKIGGDIVGVGGRSGQIQAGATIGNITIGGSLVGGALDESGYIFAIDSIGKVTIRGNIVGAAGVRSGTVVGQNGIAGLNLGGSLLGGPASVSGAILGQVIGPVRIAGDLVGGNITGSASSDSSGSIEGDSLASLFVGGSVRSGIDGSTGSLTRSGSVRFSDTIGAITIKGSIVGTPHNDGSSADGDFTPVIISAQGHAGLPATAKNDVAIGSLTVGGRVEQSQILAGYDAFGSPVGRNADAQIGPIVIGGDLIASSIVAGVGTAMPFFGTTGDAKLSGSGVKDNDDAIGAISKIGSVVIKGSVFGTAATNDLPTYAIVAQHLGSVTVGGLKLPLKSGAANDPIGLANNLGATLGATTDGFDFHAFEVS